MSTAAFSAFLKRKIIPIIAKDLKPVLNAFTQYFQFADKKHITDTLEAEYLVNTSVARDMLAYIIRDARRNSKGSKSKFYRTVINGEHAFVTRQTRAVITRPSGRFSAGTYGIVDEWKRGLNQGFNAKFAGEIDWEASDFTGKPPRPVSSLLILGHGAEGQMPAVAQRSIRAIAKAQRYGEHGNTKEENKKLVQHAILKMGKALKAEGFKVDAVIERYLDAKGEFGANYMVGLQIMSTDLNIQRAAGEKATYSTNLQKALLEQALVGKGSRSSLELISDAIDATVKGKKIKRVKSKKSIRPITYNNKKKAKRAKGTTLTPRLRTSGGQFTSAMNIQAILDATIKETVADNMGKGGALVYRTGRFAESVGVEKVMQSRQGTLTAFYTYMKAPYQTFERGFAQGSARRDPRKLISASIREIAKENLSHKLHIRTRRV